MLKLGRYPHKKIQSSHLNLGTYWLIPQAVSDCSSLALFNLLVKVSARVADITCIIQVTLKMIHIVD